MLQALVHNQIPDPDKPAFDDFIEGKGKGLIVLLQYVANSESMVIQRLPLQWSTGSGKDTDGRGGFGISEATTLPSLSYPVLYDEMLRRLLTLTRYVPEI